MSFEDYLLNEYGYDSVTVEDIIAHHAENERYRDELEYEIDQLRCMVLSAIKGFRLVLAHGVSQVSMIKRIENWLSRSEKYVNS